jgi:hypothetical protein
MNASMLVEMAKISIMETLLKAGGELDALTIFTQVTGLMGDSQDPLTVLAALELEPTDIIRATPEGLVKLKQDRDSLGGE